MTSSEIRQQFLDFFASKGHTIVPSAPIVVKNDPTLMFTNAGMNQFKDWFLGNEPAKYKRVVDTQKCLRVSGKHNDLEEVGVDTYHHTMFEMLGNWSFGDYFKTDAIAWAWELLTEVYKLDKNRLYVTVFEGDEKEGLAFDQDAYNEWKKWIAEDRILRGNKKDNFWEMGDTGPCGPCSEIHVDLRSDEERKAVDGATLVNNDHPQVIEIWNNVFMEFNRGWKNNNALAEFKNEEDYYRKQLASKEIDQSKFNYIRTQLLSKYSELKKLPAQHVDTGMGFERLVRAIEGKTSNYDTDVFMPLINFVEQLSNIKYQFSDSKQDIAMRVIADHIRAISLCIADGQLPSNNGAGYVIRRILRRALRYGFQFLGLKEPFMCKLLDVLAEQFKTVFPELINQKDFVGKVIREEELSFLKTLERGLIEFRNIVQRISEEAVKNFFDSNGLNVIQNDPYHGLNFDFKVKTTMPGHNDSEVYIELTFNENTINRFSQNINPLLVDAKKDNVDFVLIDGKHLADNDTSVFDERIINKIKSINGGKILHGFKKGVIDGKRVFELHDTFGFPVDLTKLIAMDYGFEIDEVGFESELQNQKNRSRKATELSSDEWVIVDANPAPTEFVGYDEMYLEEVHIRKYRKVMNKGKEEWQIVLDRTPFYPEGGGQVGDTGSLYKGIYDEKTSTYAEQSIAILDTKKENNLIIHIADQKPSYNSYTASIDMGKRIYTERNHSATHLLHAALREILGKHVQQKGSLVNNDYLRFDFSHFAAMTDDEISTVERVVNMKIREAVNLDERRNVSIQEAEEMGAMMLFGEKYGDRVRVITFDPKYSIELCGGTHVKNTANLGYFKIISESAVAAGVRRIEAITGDNFENYQNEMEAKMKGLKDLLKSKDVVKSVEQLIGEKAELLKRLEQLEGEKTLVLKEQLKSQIVSKGGVNVLVAEVSIPSAEQLKNLSFQLKNETENFFSVIGTILNDKPMLSVIISDNLVKEKGLHAGNIIKDLAKEIQGGGGGQPFYATAGGNKVDGLKAALEKAKGLV